eukprot:7514476-Pyramimonas_sp.AAC.1
MPLNHRVGALLHRVDLRARAVGTDVRVRRQHLERLQDPIEVHVAVLGALGVVLRDEICHVLARRAARADDDDGDGGREPGELDG